MLLREFNQLGRNIRRHKAFFLINVGGLSIGLALFMVIALYVFSEYRFDKFNENLEQIYRLDAEEWTVMASGHGPDAKANFPEVIDFVRFDIYTGKESFLSVKKEETGTSVKGFMFADPQMFDVFTLEFLQGDPETALQDPFNMVLTESLAEQLFAGDNPMNQMVMMDGEHAFRITGVIEDPERFHLDFSALASFSSVAAIKSDPHVLHNYARSNYPTYLLVKEGVDIHELEKKLTRFYGATYRQEHERDMSYALHLTPLEEIYLGEDREFGDYTKHGSKKMLYVFSSIALFILLIASVNFINLSTVRSTFRAKEVGLRKVLGGKRIHLIRQFLGESVMIIFLGFIGAVMLVELFLPAFNTLLQGEIFDEYYRSPLFWGISLLMVLLLGIISGLYPSFYLSRYQPIIVVQRMPVTGKRGIGIRSSLTIFQFSISVILIFGTITIFNQIHYMKHKDPGFDEHNQLYFSIERDMRDHKDAFKAELLRHPNITGISWISRPVGLITWQSAVKINGEKKKFFYQRADPDYMDVMGFEIVEGENFSWDKPSQQGGDAILLNQRAAQHFGLEDPVGSILPAQKNFSDEDVEIIGVVKDFHYTSFHHEIAPLAIAWEDFTQTANLRISGKDTESTLQHIQKTWHEFFPGSPFEYHFVAQTMNRMYKKEERFARLFIAFAFFAILIACMGMYGLSLFSTRQRRKEIGIRKVNGAQVKNVVGLFLKDFSANVLVANIIALPVAYYLMDGWLRNFAYHIGLEWWIYFASLFLSLMVAVVTVCYNTVKAANTNPAWILRDE